MYTSKRTIQYWSVDFAGSLPKTKNVNQYLLVGIEGMSEWLGARTIPAEHFKALGALKFVNEGIILPFCSSKFILSDNDLKFDCKPVEDFARDQKFNGNKRLLITYQVIVLLSAWWA